VSRQLSFMPETPDEDGDQLDLLEEVAKVETDAERRHREEHERWLRRAAVRRASRERDR
jgi:hypothetical protein